MSVSKKSLGVVSLIAAGILASGVASAELIASSSVVMFGDVPLGQTASVNVLVTNIGELAVQGITTSVSGNSQEFDVAGCSTVLLPGRSCVLSITLIPQHYGAKRRKLTIDGVEVQADGSTNDVSLTVDLVGTSDNPNKP